MCTAGPPAVCFGLDQSRRADTADPLWMAGYAVFGLGQTGIGLATDVGPTAVWIVTVAHAHWMTGVTGGRIKPKHCEMKDHFAHSCLTTAGSLEAIPHPGHRTWVGAQSWWMETAKVPQPSMSKRRVGYRNSNDEEWWGRNAGGKPRDGEGYVNGRLQCRPAAGG